MQLRQIPACRGTIRSLLPLLLLLGAGCGDDAADPAPTPDCAISGLNTSLEDNWVTGDIVSIRWTGNGVPGTVVIELLKAGSPVATIAPAAANTGFYPWLAALDGLANDSDYGIRVTGTGDAACTAEVNDLTILNVAGCSFTLAGPLSAVNAGDDLEIVWSSAHTAGFVDIELWTSGTGDMLDEKVGDIALGEPDDGSFMWTADSFHNGTYDFYRLVIRDVRVDGCEAVGPQFRLVDEDNCIIIVGGPTGMPLDVGDQMIIQLDQTQGSGFVNLRLYTGSEFVRGGIIADNVSVLADFPWTVTDFEHDEATNRYNIRAIDVADPYCVGRSANFTINP